MARQRRQATRAERWGVLLVVMVGVLSAGVVLGYARAHQWSMARQLLAIFVVVGVASALISGALHWNRPRLSSVDLTMDRIRQGREPEWRLVFEDRLDGAARERIRHALRAASAVADPDEAAVAAGFARREQRRVLFLGLIVLPLQLAMALVYVVWFLAGTLRLPAAFGWFWVAVLLVLVGAVPVALRRRYQHARRAAEANERVARRQP